MPAATFRMNPPRTMSTWLTTWASAGLSLSVGMNARDRRMDPGLYLIADTLAMATDPGLDETVSATAPSADAPTEVPSDVPFGIPELLVEVDARHYVDRALL